MNERTNVLEASDKELVISDESCFNSVQDIEETKEPKVRSDDITNPYLQFPRLRLNEPILLRAKQNDAAFDKVLDQLNHSNANNQSIELHELSQEIEVKIAEHAPVDMALAELNEFFPRLMESRAPNNIVLPLEEPHRKIDDLKTGPISDRHKERKEKFKR